MVTVIILKKPCTEIRSRIGVTRSNKIKSYENRETILPVVSESKKFILALSTMSVIVLCRLVAHLRMSLKITSDRTIVIMKKIPMRMQNTIGYFGSHYSSDPSLNHSIIQIEGSS